MQKRAVVLLGILLLAAAAGPAAAQDQSWRNRWYWGTQGGAQAFFSGGRTLAPTAGAHWFITGGRSALYLGFDQMFFSSRAIALGTGQNISFGSGQRLQAGVYAVPTDSKLQLMIGGGFAIQHITDGSLTDPLPTSLDERNLEDASTKAVLQLGGGWQYRVGERWAIFGMYHYLPGSSDFIIRSTQHIGNLGIRYAVTHAQEAVTTER